MKTQFLLHLTVTIFLFLLQGCTPEITELNYSPDKTDKAEFEIEISKESITIREGHTAALSAVIRPWSQQNNTLTWASSDPSVATVDEKGQITALSIGKTTITVSSKEISAECEVNVISWEIPMESIEIDTTPISLKVNDSKTISAVILPENTTDQLVITSSDESIASVDAAGTVVGKKTGTAIISVIVGKYSCSIPVLVHGNLWLEQTEALTKPVSFETFAWEPDTIRVARGETATLQTIIYAAEAQGVITPKVEYISPAGQKSGLSMTPEMFWLPDIKCSNKWDTWAGGPAPDRYPDNQKYLPDPLIPIDERTISLAQGEKIPMWVEFEIPRNIEAGIYEGLVSVSGNESGSLPFTIQVYDVTLPEKQTLSVLQWLNYSELNAMVTDPSTLHMHANYERLENILIPFMAKYGTNSFRTFYCRSWDADLHFVKNASGEFVPTGSFNSLKKDIDLMIRACPDFHYAQGENVIASVADKTTTGELLISGYALNEDGSIKLTDNGNGKYYPEHVYVHQGAQYSPEAEAYMSNYFHALQEFLRSQTMPDGRTWLDIYLQTICDEPVDVTVPAYERIASYIRKGAPDLKIMEPLTTGLIGHEYIDIPCPVTSMLDNNPYNIFCNGPFEYGSNQTRWSYTCVQPQGNSLNRFIRIPLFKTRYIHWLDFLYDNVGYLHWGPNYWVGSPDGDPWKDAAGSYIGGDMFIIWPGPETVYASIRLCAMRDGLRDYELLKMVAAISEGDAKDFCRKVVWSSCDYETDMDSFRSTRKEILEYLSR